MRFCFLAYRRLTVVLIICSLLGLVYFMFEEPWYYYDNESNLVTKHVINETVLMVPPLLEIATVAQFTRQQHTCSLQSIQQRSLDVKSKASSHSGSCARTHTKWDTNKQVASVQCLPNETAMYRSKPYSFDSPIESVMGWSLYEKPFSTANMDVIQTACVSNSARHNFYVQAVRNETLSSLRKAASTSRSNKGNSRKPPVNIHIIMLDACSRNTFFRHFPHTAEYLEQLEQLKENSTFSMLKFDRYHVLDQNSDPNMYALSTGKTFPYNTTSFEAYGLNIASGITKRGEKLLWEHLQDIGYVTTVGEDVAYSRTGLFYGIQKKNQTFDVYPAFQVPIYTTTVDHHYDYLYQATRCACLGNRFSSELMYEFVQSFSNVYKDNPQFVLTVNDETHDSTQKQVVTLDSTLKNHLQWYVNSGRLENTILLLMSDHGMHYGDPYQLSKSRAEYEHQYPLMKMFVPKHLVTEQLLANTDKLIGMKDLHKTIRDFATFPERSSDLQSADSASLIHDLVPHNRTCAEMNVVAKFRTYCDQSSIKQEFLACNETVFSNKQLGCSNPE